MYSPCLSLMETFKEPDGEAKLMEWQLDVEQKGVEGNENEIKNVA